MLDLKEDTTPVQNNVQITAQLLNVYEFCKYLNIGTSQGRDLLRNPDCTYSLKLGRRWYAHKELLDQWLIDKTHRNR